MTIERQEIEHVWQCAQKDFGGESYEVISSGATSDVLLVENASNPYVIKVRRTGNSSHAYNMLQSEIDNVSVLGDFGSAPLPVPQALDLSADPSYGVFSYIPGVPIGELLPTGDFLPQEQQKSIGHKIGLFVAWLEVNCSASYDRLASSPHQFDLIFPGILDTTLEIQNLGFPSLALAMSELSSLAHLSLIPRLAIGHRDLHVNNLLIDPSTQEITGVIDFAYLGPTTPEYEMRALLPIGPHAVDSAVEAYQETTGNILSEEAVRYWLLGRWTTMCVINIIHTRRIAVPNAKLWLETLCPDDDWSEIDRWNQRH